MNKRLSEYELCVKKLRALAGFNDAKPKSIREALRDDSFEDTIREALHCKLLDNWPLDAQSQFMESLRGLNDMQKRVRIHEMAYSLYRAEKYALSPV